MGMKNVTTWFMWAYNKSIFEISHPELPSGVEIYGLHKPTLQFNLSQTTAGFAFNDYFYLFAGNRVCRMHNTTLRFDDNCFNQSIAQWIGCEDYNKFIIIAIVNPLCDPNITIDSAFVDKYCDLGSDVITLFADNTVYQLTVETTDPMKPNLKYKRSQSLKEWSNYGSISPPIDVVYYEFNNGYVIALLNVIRNKLTVDEIEGYLSQTTAGFAFNDYFYLFAGNRVCLLQLTNTSDTESVYISMNALNTMSSISLPPMNGNRPTVSQLKRASI
ncbi:unnamed protein product [Medioppia subpectinata]|uniref:Uncharacterized protein n=1 Tax=Medioppia subpectinata TaxID=1979941 RepID=A0A7R9KMR9_9ACAR|nr:unnamed protein product [Medioppia subpectinata]CAG2106407.1 unnamed protein product [Medioppia subpectinata]